MDYFPLNALSVTYTSKHNAWHVMNKNKLISAHSHYAEAEKTWSMEMKKLKSKLGVK